MPAGFELNLLLTIKASQGILWGAMKKNSPLYQLFLAILDETRAFALGKSKNLENLLGV